MAALTEAAKVFVVQQLAMWRTPSEVVDDVKELFGVEASRSQVAYYHPEGSRADDLADRWKTLFRKTREAYLAQASEVGIFHQVVRLRELDDALRRAKRMGRHGNVPLILQILKQAAEEVGGKFTNHQLVDMKHSGQVKTTGVMLVPAEVAAADWSAAAREAQDELAQAAEDATTAMIRRSGPIKS